ncbi:hypothetical protein LAZ67_1005347 [Cordylochernes scorpioides]|uniref:SPIN-DOC-like zinc-finger domain-containing protein n=1 Tax=Cordylochernes scorpioides TaxID=51811 RepID=A0ABY6JY24_9ARAC|nr:hypothetical protein LAZ67_1005347 [Cordylochernes scorpioides]
MSSSKPSGSKTKRKITDEHRNFQEKWELEYFCSEVKDKIICLICNNAISVPKLYNIKRHYEQHKSKYDTYEGLMRQEKLKEFKLGMKKQQFMFTKVSQESEAAVHASYVLSEMIAKHSKPFTEGDFIKECLIKAAEIVCPGSVKTFQAISLSRNTVVERVTDMARNLNDQIKEKSSCFEAFSIACDETTDGAPSMTGKTNGFVALLRKKLSETSDGSNIHHTHCIIHQEVLCTKIMVPTGQASWRLVAFDFDHTIVDGNSDVQVQKLAPDETIPDSIQDHYSPNGWTNFMREVFRYLHSQGISQEDYVACLNSLPLVQGIKELFKILHEQGNEIVIISDANSIFIEHVLKKEGLSVAKIFTNPAYFDEEGRLCINEYQDQDWCTLCSRNLCKGSILKDYIAKRQEEGVNFNQVAYVGDGRNDLCPSLTLTSRDLVFPRKGFKLDSLIQEKKEDLDAAYFTWESGHDIRNILFTDNLNELV